MIDPEAWLDLDDELRAMDDRMLAQTNPPRSALTLGVWARPQLRLLWRDRIGFVRSLILLPCPTPNHAASSSLVQPSAASFSMSCCKRCGAWPWPGPS
jgi:hypothetical protein